MGTKPATALCAINPSLWLVRSIGTGRGRMSTPPVTALIRVALVWSMLAAGIRVGHCLVRDQTCCGSQRMC